MTQVGPTTNATPATPSTSVPTLQPTVQVSLQPSGQPTDQPVNTPVNHSLVSPSGSGLLFDPSIIGSLPVVTPVPPMETQSASGTVQPAGLTRSDSLAAVIADLNQTLAQSSVSNGM